MDCSEHSICISLICDLETPYPTWQLYIVCNSNTVCKCIVLGYPHYLPSGSEFPQFLPNNLTFGWLEARLLLLEPRNQTKIIRFYSCIFPFKTHLVAGINWKLLSRTYWCGLVAESSLTWAEMVFYFQNCSDLLWENNCSSDWEKLLNFEAEDREFASFLRWLIQFIRTAKGQNSFSTCSRRFHRSNTSD